MINETSLVTKKELMSETTNKLKLGIYISRLLSQIHKNLSISSAGKETLNMMLQNVIERILNVAQDITFLGNKMTIGGGEVQIGTDIILPEKLGKNCISEARRSIGKFSSQNQGGLSDGNRAKPVTKSSRAGLVIPVTRIGNFMRSKTSGSRQGAGAPIYMAAVIEYLTCELLELSGNVTLNDKSEIISPHHIFLAVSSDDELSELFKGIKIGNGTVFFNQYSQNSSLEPFLWNEELQKLITKLFNKKVTLRFGKDSDIVLKYILKNLIEKITFLILYFNKKTVSLKYVQFSIKYTCGLKMSSGDEASTSTSTSKRLFGIAPFQRLVRKISETFLKDDYLRFSSDSLKLIQSSIESYLTELAEKQSIKTQTNPSSMSETGKTIGTKVYVVVLEIPNPDYKFPSVVISIKGVFSTKEKAQKAKRISMIEALEYHDIVNMREKTIEELFERFAELEKDLKSTYDMENCLEVRIEEKIIDLM